MTLDLSKQQIKYLRKLCVDAESKGALTAPILKIIYKEKWFKFFIPKELDGLELSLPDALKYEEELAYVDGSLGWTVTLCAGANLFAGYIQHKKSRQMFSSKKICLGGSGAVGGIAEEVKDGYIVNGFWKYATGAPHLTHFTANCHIQKDGKLVLNEDGSKSIRSFFFKKEEVKIHPEWNTMGLKATAGHSFSVKNLKLDSDQSFLIDENHTTLNQLIYRYPFLPFAETTTAVNTLGMTRHFFELAEQILKDRRAKIGASAYLAATNEIALQQQKIQTLSESFYQSVQTSWNELLQKEKIAPKSEKKISIISRQLAKACRNSVSAVYPYCGLAATSQHSEINRVFRDIFTASQHGLLAFA